MAYSVTRVENYNTYCIYHFLCDSSSDLATIVSDYTDKGLRAGWTATTTDGDTTKAFILGNDLSTWASYDASGVLSEVPVADGGGWDSIVQKTINRPEDVDSHGNQRDRTNTADGNFSGAFGSRNTVDSDSSETFAFGGKNKAYHTEDALVFGYENTTYSAHQSIVGGYDNTVTASESSVFGEHNTVIGTESSGKTNTRRVFVYGTGNTVGDANGSSPGSVQECFIGGNGNVTGNSVYYSFIHGQQNTVETDCQWVNVFGGSNNTLHSHLTDSTVMGYRNELYGGPNGSSKRESNFVFGHHNTVQNGNTEKGWNDIYMMGEHLLANHSKQVVFGKYNTGGSEESNDILTVGNGSSDGRRDAFGVGTYDGLDGIRIGNVSLNSGQLEGLLSAIPSKIKVDKWSPGSVSISIDGGETVSVTDGSYIYCTTATITAEGGRGRDLEIIYKDGSTESVSLQSGHSCTLDSYNSLYVVVH